MIEMVWGDAPRVLVINETKARRLFPGENPLGQRVVMPSGGPEPFTFEVAGVVGDARIYGVGREAPMTMYSHVRQLPRIVVTPPAR